MDLDHLGKKDSEIGRWGDEVLGRKTNAECGLRRIEGYRRNQNIENSPPAVGRYEEGPP